MRVRDGDAEARPVEELAVVLAVAARDGLRRGEPKAVRDEPEAAFLIAPIKAGRKSETEPQEPKVKERAKKEVKEQSGLAGKEIAGLELLIQQRAAADEAFFAWLRGNHSLPLSEWRKRRAQARRARRAEDLYLEKLFKSRSVRRS